MVDDATRLVLPIGVITRADLGRLIGEAETLDNFLRAAAIRLPGTAVQPPRQSQLFDDLVTSNKLNMLLEADRGRLSQFLLLVRSQAPILHMSFTSDPSGAFQQRIIAWVRGQVHPQALLQIGLNPSIGAGCAVRTTNKYFDFSLRQRFINQRTMLIEKLRGRDEPGNVAATPEANVSQGAS